MELNMRDPTTIAVVGAILVATLLFFCYAMVDNCRQSKRTHRWLALHQPLHPSAIDLRLDAALRDAQDGFSVCDACAFENLKRNIFCTLCGAPVTDPATAGGATGTGKKKSKALAGKRKDKLLVRQQLASASNNNRRRARALKRKEWARRLDAQGRLVWVHHPSAAPERGFVLQFHGDPLVAAEDAKDAAADQDSEDSSTKPGPQGQPETEPVEESHVAIAINDAGESEATTRASAVDAATTQTSTDGQDTESQQHTPKPKLELLPLDATSERLEGEISSHPMQVADAATADPLRPAIVLRAMPQFSEEPKVLVATTQLNFPAKLAEFVTRASTVMMLSEQSFLKFKIRRKTLLADSLLALAATPARCARCPVRMNFVGEQGIDAGGVYREWLVLVNEQIVAPSAGIFRCVDSRDRSFYLSPTSQQDIGEHHLAHFFATGRLLGRMLLEGNVTGFHLALPLLKIIVGQPVTFSDLEYFDPEAFKSLTWLLENDNVDTLGLDFTVTEQTASGEMIVEELVPGGAQVDVTDVNKREYVDLKFKYLLFGSVQQQLFAFLKGLYEVMPPELLMMFDAEELDFVLSGSDEIDVDDWERNAKYTEDLVEHPVRGWFWEILRDMPNEYRRRLLLFSTGSSRVPLAGFAALTSYDGRLCPFTLKGVDMAEGGEYIHSHACFNRLDLPRYAKKKDLKAVLYGILDTDLYGFTTA